MFMYGWIQLPWRWKCNAISNACSVPCNSHLKGKNLKYTSSAENKFYTHGALINYIIQQTLWVLLHFPYMKPKVLGVQILSQASSCTIFTAFYLRCKRSTCQSTAPTTRLLFTTFIFCLEAQVLQVRRKSTKLLHMSTWAKSKGKHCSQHSSAVQVTQHSTEQHWQVALFVNCNHLYQCKHVGIPYKNIQKCFFSRGFAIQCTLSHAHLG